MPCIVSLNMGGLAGHISHCHEDYDLTLNDLTDIVRGVADGSIETFEKFDGVNIVFTWAPSGLRFARSKGDILSGGMGRTELVEKFARRTGVFETFTEGFDVLETALRAVPNKAQLFADGTVWCSVELCCRKNSNVIEYDEDFIVLHDFPTFNEQGERRTNDVSITGDLLGTMPMSVDGWHIIGPTKVALSDLDDVVDTFGLEIKDIAEDTCTLDANLRDLYERVFDALFVGSLDDGATVYSMAMIADKVLGCAGALHLRDLNKLLTVADQRTVRQWLQDSSAKKRCLGVIESPVRRAAIDLLKHACSTMINAPVNKQQRLRKRLERALDSDDPVVNQERPKLGDVSNANAFIEGVVFTYKGRQYKLTGSYAPVNRILGVERFA